MVFAEYSWRREYRDLPTRAGIVLTTETWFKYAVKPVCWRNCDWASKAK